MAGSMLVVPSLTRHTGQAGRPVWRQYSTVAYQHGYSLVLALRTGAGGVVVGGCVCTLAEVGEEEGEDGGREGVVVGVISDDSPRSPVVSTYPHVP